MDRRYGFKTTSLTLLGLALTSVASHTVAATGTHSWKPRQHVEIIAPSGAGGAIDRTARLIQELAKRHKLLDVTTSIVNKPGGGHSIGYSYLNQFAGNGHYLLVTSVNLVTNYLVGTSPIPHTEITPIALLFNEYVTFAVSAESPVKTTQDLIATFRERPEDLSIGVGSAISGANATATGLVARLAGTSPKQLKIVAFKSAKEATTALIGGHITLVATSPSTLVTAFKAGRIRPLAVSAPKRLGGVFASVPTWRELGSDIVVGNWRILIGPNGLPDETLAFWDEVMSKVAATPEWLKNLERNSAVPEYLNSRDTRRFLDEQADLFRNTFMELGIIKGKK